MKMPRPKPQNSELIFSAPAVWRVVALAHGWRQHLAVPCIAMMVIWFAFGCATPPRTTRMTVDDFEAISREMAASLAASPALSNRTPASAPWVISINKVENLSSDVMTDSEQWAIIAKIRGTLPIEALWDQKNVRFVIPAPQQQKLPAAGVHTDQDARFGSHRRPTHQMAATFRSITRADAQHRTELYYCEFQILDLISGEPIWSDRFEFKRAAKGHIWD